jgi:hypothetical protein
MDDFGELVKYCKTKGITVKLVGDSVLHDFAGMNKFAGDKFGFKPKLKHNEILIDKHLSNSVKFKTLKHELVERDLMSEGESYWSAHKTALECEE